MIAGMVVLCVLAEDARLVRGGGGSTTLRPLSGATRFDCTVTTDRQNDGVNVTVSSVNGGTVNFDVIETVSKDDIAGQISERLNQQSGRAPNSSRAGQPEGHRGCHAALYIHRLPMDAN